MCANSSARLASESRTGRSEPEASDADDETQAGDGRRDPGGRIHAVGGADADCAGGGDGRPSRAHGEAAASSRRRYIAASSRHSSRWMVIGSRFALRCGSSAELSPAPRDTFASIRLGCVGSSTRSPLAASPAGGITSPTDEPEPPFLRLTNCPKLSDDGHEGACPRRKMPPRRAAYVFDRVFGRRFIRPGFLSHLRSLRLR